MSCFSNAIALADTAARRDYVPQTSHDLNSPASFEHSQGSFSKSKILRRAASLTPQQVDSDKTFDAAKAEKS